MTRFDMASLNPMNMSKVIAFCIEAFLESYGIKALSDDEIRDYFMSEISRATEEWLRGEV